MRTWDGASGEQARSFEFLASDKAGVNVASGDLNDDGHADVIVGAAGSRSQILALEGRELRELGGFEAYPATPSVCSSAPPASSAQSWAPEPPR